MTAAALSLAQQVFSAVPNPEDKELIDAALAIAIPAARLARDKRISLGDVRAYTTTKSSAVDPVTIVDTAVEKFIAVELQRTRPADGVIGEEGTEQPSASGISWILDPIDGTVNFLYGIPTYAVSIAAAREGIVRAGVVVNIATGEMYAAARGAGAWKLDGKTYSAQRLAATQEHCAAQALVATGFSYSALRRQAQAEILGTLLPAVRDIRRLGSAALDLCQLAEGRVDAYYEHALNAWDYAGGLIIAEEAGACVQAPALSVPGSEGQLLWGCAPGLAEEFGQLMGTVPLRLRG